LKIGLPALVEYTSIKQLVDLCTELNINFIELNMNMPYNFIENINPLELKKITQDLKIEFTMHMPDDADLGSFYPSVREGYVKLFSDTIEWAHKAGIKLLNLHIIEGAKMTLPDKKVYMYDKYRDDFLNNFINSIKILSPLAEINNIILAIENSSNFGKEYIQNVLDKALTFPNIKLTWDTGHDSVSGFTDREYLMKNQNKIAHMHLHDAKGTKDHQVPFEGDLDIQGLITFAKQNNISTLIEVKTPEAVKKSINILKSKNLI
jgi:sugar phosphate isomerase/epimerase